MSWKKSDIQNGQTWMRRSFISFTSFFFVVSVTDGLHSDIKENEHEIDVQVYYNVEKKRCAIEKLGIENNKKALTSVPN